MLYLLILYKYNLHFQTKKQSHELASTHFQQITFHLVAIFSCTNPRSYYQVMYDCPILIFMLTQDSTPSLYKLSWISSTCTEDCHLTSRNIHTFIQTLHGSKDLQFATSKIIQYS